MSKNTPAVEAVEAPAVPSQFGAKGEFRKPILISEADHRTVVPTAAQREWCEANEMVWSFPLRDESSRASSHARGWQEFLDGGAEVIKGAHVMMIQPKNYHKMRQEAFHEMNDNLEATQMDSLRAEVAAAVDGQVIGKEGATVDRDDLKF